MKLSHAPSHEIIRSLINSIFSKPIDVIDYGCGDGLIISVLGKSNFKHYDGFDSSEAAIRVAEKRFTDTRFKFKHITEMPILKSDTYDVALLIGVLQYIPSKEIPKLLSAVYNSLKENSYLIMSVSSNHLVYSLLDIYKYILPHNNFMPEEIHYLLKKAGFTYIVTRERGAFIAPLFSHTLAPIIDGFDRLILGARGQIGPVGSLIRRLLRPLIYADFFSTKNFGYTCFVIAKKI